MKPKFVNTKKRNKFRVKWRQKIRRKRPYEYYTDKARIDMHLPYAGLPLPHQ
jgi:hypothetical protein